MADTSAQDLFGTAERPAQRSGGSPHRLPALIGAAHVFRQTC
jgi:hypothetical protein